MLIQCSRGNHNLLPMSSKSLKVCGLIWYFPGGHADQAEFRDNIEDDEDEEGEVQVALQKMILEQLINFLAALE